MGTEFGSVKKQKETCKKSGPGAQQAAGRTHRRTHHGANSCILTLLVQGEKEVMHRLLPQGAV